MLFADECSVSLVERASALQRIPLHHEMSGYEVMISDILRVCLFLISLPFSSIDMCMVICTFTYLNTNACDQNKLMLMIVLSYLELLITNISFVSMTCIHTVKFVSIRGFSVAVNEIFVHVDTHLPHLVGIKKCLSIKDRSVVVNTIYRKRLTWYLA